MEEQFVVAQAATFIRGLYILRVLVETSQYVWPWNPSVLGFLRHLFLVPFCRELFPCLHRLIAGWLREVSKNLLLGS